jgi:hypothetical protein
MKEIISDLKTKLESITGIQEVIMSRDVEPTKYPAIICNWATSDNSFENTSENRKLITFNLAIVINVAGKKMSEIDEVIIPNAFDLLESYVDENWNFGTIDGHRVRMRLSSSDNGITVEDKSKLAWVDCRLQIEYNKDIE